MQAKRVEKIVLGMMVLAVLACSVYRFIKNDIELSTWFLVLAVYLRTFSNTKVD